jgi:serine/threonine-protein kinase RsbW
MAGEHSSSQGPSRGGSGASSRAPGARVEAVESEIRLTVPARAENVAVVRRVIGALAAALDLPRAVVDDMRLAVTEACTNVVRHAYADGTGQIDVVVRPDGGALEVIVADAGRGIGPSMDTSGPGFGLPLIAALADSLEIERSAGTGSRLIMSFLRTRATPSMGVA